MWWIILLSIFALIFLLLWQNVHVIVSYKGEFKLIAGLGLIRLDIMKLLNKPKKPKEEKPEKEKKKKDEGEKKEDKDKEKEKKEKPPNVFQEVWRLRGVDGAIDLLSEFATLINDFGDGLVKHFVIRKIFVRYSVHGKDAADTAIKFGVICPLIFSPLGVISSKAKVKKHDIIITPDYLGNQEQQEVELHISYKILSILAVGVKAVIDFLKINSREKKINERIKTRSRQKKSKQAV